MTCIVYFALNTSQILQNIIAWIYKIDWMQLEWAINYICYLFENYWMESVHYENNIVLIKC
jgi:hypothetical protein